MLLYGFVGLVVLFLWASTATPSGTAALERANSAPQLDRSWPDRALLEGPLPAIVKELERSSSLPVHLNHESPRAQQLRERLAPVDARRAARRAAAVHRERLIAYALGRRARDLIAQAWREADWHRAHAERPLWLRIREIARQHRDRMRDQQQQLVRHHPRRARPAEWWQAVRHGAAHGAAARHRFAAVLLRLQAAVQALEALLRTRDLDPGMARYGTRLLRATTELEMEQRWGLRRLNGAGWWASEVHPETLSRAMNYGIRAYLHEERQVAWALKKLRYWRRQPRRWVQEERRLLGV